MITIKNNIFYIGLSRTHKAFAALGRELKVVMRVRTCVLRKVVEVV